MLLSEKGIDLILAYGQASPTEKLRKDEGYLDWAERCDNRFFHFLGKDLLWQSLGKLGKNADLIVVMQENRILSNYPLLLKRLLGGPKVAYWGHGKNYQSTAPRGLREKWKALMLKQVDWWFAYTETAADYVEKNGYPLAKITNLNNAIDVSGFQRDLSSVNETTISTAMREFGFVENCKVGLYCGSLYPEKRVDLLLAAADLIRAEIPDFQMLIVGDGPTAHEVKEASRSRPWMHCLGVRKGVEKALYFRMADVLLNPGAVGLHVLDAFAAGVPMITTRNALHGPEVSYLKNGYNGVITDEDDPVAYSAPVIEILRNKNLHKTLKSNCLQDAQRYTVENMARCFSEGIEKCLDMYGLWKKDEKVSFNVTN